MTKTAQRIARAVKTALNQNLTVIIIIIIIIRIIRIMFVYYSSGCQTQSCTTVYKSTSNTIFAQ